MGIDLHIIQDNHAEPTVIGKRVNVPNVAGSGANNPVTTAVSFVDRYGGGKLPPSLNYAVIVTPNQLCAVAVTGKTATGFSVVLTPPSGVTLASGTFDVIVIA
jgi:hypothetical protein